MEKSGSNRNNMKYLCNRIRTRWNNILILRKDALYLSVKCGLSLLNHVLYERKRINRYPYTIQLPITYKCNFNCVMCGMSALCTNTDFNAEELGHILDDKLYSQIVSIGINGGEPFLKNDLLSCIDVIIKKIPTLQSFSFISNGYFTERMCELLTEIKKMCKKSRIKMNLAISVDGIGDMQDFMRGKKGAWENVNKTLVCLRENADEYYDSLNIICTITKHNIFKIYEVESWAKKNQLNIVYNIATVNARIANDGKVNDFSIFSDEEAKMFAAEFFYKKFFETKSEQYFAIYYFIINRQRIAECDCKYNRWVTLTPNGQLGYCATHSRNLGNALEQSSYNLFNDNIRYLKEIRKKYCSKCSHYIYGLDSKGILQYYKELKRINRYW